VVGGRAKVGDSKSCWLLRGSWREERALGWDAMTYRWVARARGGWWLGKGMRGLGLRRWARGGMGVGDEGL